MEDIIKNTPLSTSLLIAYGVLLFVLNIIVFKIIAMYGSF
jgi:hypothetical protein